VRKFLIASLLLASACKGKPAHREPPANAVAQSGSASGSDGKRAAPDLALPQGPGTPPLKTTRKLGKADFEKLAKLEYPGFHTQEHGLTDNFFEIRQITNDHPRLWATVTIEPCGKEPDDCPAMDLDTWKKREPELKKMLGDLANQPDVDFDIGTNVLHGQTLIYTYQLGQHAGSGEGGGMFTFSDAYILYYNDGVNRIRVVAEYKDDPVKTKEMMAKQAPKADLGLLAISFLDVYTHAWPTS
jgi:hypothetical protein